MDETEIQTIRDALTKVRSVDRAYNVDLVDAGGTVHASIEKMIYVRRKETASMSSLIS